MIVTVASEGGGGGGNSIFTGAGAGGGIGRGALLKSTSVTRLFATMLASPAFRKISDSDKDPTLVASDIFCA
jgi:hypothetical protein